MSGNYDAVVIDLFAPRDKKLGAESRTDQDHLNDELSDEDFAGEHPLLRSMLRYIAPDDPDFADLKQLFQQILQDPSCPSLDLSYEELRRLGYVLSWMDEFTELSRFESAAVAILYMGEIGGWNPNLTRPLRDLPFSTQTKIKVELGYGALGFAWQIRYKKPLIFKQGTYYEMREELKKAR